MDVIPQEQTRVQCVPAPPLPFRCAHRAGGQTAASLDDGVDFTKD